MNIYVLIKNHSTIPNDTPTGEAGELWTLGYFQGHPPGVKSFQPGFNSSTKTFRPHAVVSIKTISS